MFPVTMQLPAALSLACLLLQQLGHSLFVSDFALAFLIGSFDPAVEGFGKVSLRKTSGLAQHRSSFILLVAFGPFMLVFCPALIFSLLRNLFRSLVFGNLFTFFRLGFGLVDDLADPRIKVIEV